MPRAADLYPQKRGGNDDHNPLKQGTDWTSPIDMTAGASGGRLANLFAGIPLLDELGNLIDNPIVNFILDLLSEVPVFGPLVEAITGVLSGDPGAALDALTNFFGPLREFLPFLNTDGGSFDLVAAAGQFIGMILNPAASIVTFLTGLIPGLDASIITSGSFPQAIVTGLGTIAANATGAITGVLDWFAGFFNAGTGQTAAPGTVTAAQASQVAEDLVAAQIAAATAIAQLKAAADGAGNSGVSGGDVFEVVNTTGLDAADWHTTSANPLATAGGYKVLDGHQAAFVPGSNLGLDQRMLYRRIKPVDAHTITNYQRVRAITGTFSGDPAGFGVNASELHLWARLADDESSGVFVYINGDGVAQFGYRVGGVDTMTGPVVGGVSRSAAAWLDLVAGTVASERQFLLQLNGATVLPWTDTGLVTALGAANRGWGWGGFGDGYGSGITRPPNVDAVTINDNTPATVYGTQFRAYRTAVAGAVNMGSRGPGEFAVPNSYYDQLDYISNDLTWNPLTQILTVRDAGIYSFTISHWSATGMNFGIEFGSCIFRDAGSGFVMFRRGGVSCVNNTSSRIYTTLENVPLGAGHQVKPGLTLNAFIGANNFVGDAPGTVAEFSVAKVA